jgi:hypothetical protein
MAGSVFGSAGFAGAAGAGAGRVVVPRDCADSAAVATTSTTATDHMPEDDGLTVIR